MRRKDREILNRSKIDDIINKAATIHLGLNDNGEVYIVPLSFGYDGECLYFHSSKEGRKIDILKRTHFASFELETNTALQKSPLACEYSMYYECVMGSGDVEFIEGHDEKTEALRHIMSHYTHSEAFVFPFSALDSVCCFKLRISSLSCKCYTP